MTFTGAGAALKKQAELCKEGRKAQRAFGQTFCVPNWVPTSPFDLIRDLDPIYLWVAGGLVLLLVVQMKRSNRR